MAKFEKVSKYLDDTRFNLPIRKTANSAGYDFEVSAPIDIPSYMDSFSALAGFGKTKDAINLSSLNKITKDLSAKPTLVPTGVKCKLADNEYLELSVRSSCPLKYWLILANGVGIIDSDYYNNPDNEGEIFFQIINLSPFTIHLNAGDIIGQGIIHNYITTEDDIAAGSRLGGFGSTSND